MMERSLSRPLVRGPVPLTHMLMQRFVQAGCLAIDATCGNGKDTLQLAGLVGDSGHVWAFDIQQEALHRTAARLEEAGLAARVTLVHQGHEQLGRVVESQVGMVVFNLGWLPGAPREIATTAETTLQALEAALAALIPGGVLLITCYPGHAGGDDETDAVLAWSERLEAKNFHVWRMGQVNVSTNAPFCLAIQKTESHHAV